VPIIPALRRLTQEDPEFKVNLGCIVRAPPTVRATLTGHSPLGEMACSTVEQFHCLQGLHKELRAGSAWKEGSPSSRKQERAGRWIRGKERTGKREKGQQEIQPEARQKEGSGKEEEECAGGRRMSQRQHGRGRRRWRGSASLVLSPTTAGCHPCC
jgi:hypothetical protein